MHLRFDYAPDREFYALRFEAGTYESVPHIRELRFWGVDRTPCPQLSTLAALIALRHQSVIAITLGDAGLTPSVCTAFQRHFGLEIHPARYDIDRRELAGGDRTVAPVRFARLAAGKWPAEGVEVLTWISLDDLRGPFGGQVRTNVDAFDLTEMEKSLIVALCCGGREVGRVVVDEADEAMAEVFHRAGLELVAADRAT